MIAGIYNLRPGRLPMGSVKLLVLVWLVSEVVAFSFMVKVFGLGLTLLLTLGSTVLGVAMLRRLGMDAAQHLRRTMGQGGAKSDLVVDGSLTALGALLLIIPGFVSGLVGLALASPSVRQTLLSRFVTRDSPPARKPMGRNARPDVIDLSPDDWRVVDRTDR